MLLYCSKCNNLVDKTKDETCKEGDLIERKCQKCGQNTRFYVQYRAVVDRKWFNLTAKRNYDIIV